MNEFVKTSFDQVLLEPISGSRPKGGVNTEGDIPSLGGENVTMTGGVKFYPVKKISFEFYNSMSRGHLRDLDVLINKDGANTGKSGIYRNSPYQSAAVNEHLFILRGKEGVLEQEYLHYLLQLPSVRSILNTKITGSAQPGLNTAFVQNFPIELAPLQEQKKIASILTSVDKVIQNTQKQIDKLQDLKKATMNELLTKGIGHTEFKDSELGRIPKIWEVKRLDEVAINHDSQRVPIKSEDRQNIQGIYRYYGASGIIDYVEDYIFDGRYILLGEDGENILSRNLPLAFIVEGKFWVNNHAHIIQPKEQINIGFLCEYLESLDYKNISSGSAQPKITKSALNDIRVKIPPIDEQNEIVKKLSSMDETLKSIKEKIAKNLSLKKSLMKDLLTGKTRVKAD